MSNPNEQEVADQAAYGAAFDEMAPSEQPDTSNPEEGLEMPDDAVQAAGEGDPAAQNSGEVTAEAGQIVKPETGPETTPAVADEAAANEEPVVDDKEGQRLKSWEGRLRKMEAELNAKKQSGPESAADAIEKAGEQADSSGNTELGDAARDAAEQVEDGTMTAAQAVKQLSEDFGDEFVKLIETLVSAKAAEVGKKAASESVGQVDKRVQDIISHIADEGERTHFERIANAVPDFDDIRQSPKFAEFVASGGATRQAVADGGGTKDVIKLLKEFKAQEQAAQDAAAKTAPAKPKPVDEASADAAAGVRSSGSVSLPAEPADANDFEGAWNEASARG